MFVWCSRSADPQGSRTIWREKPIRLGMHWYSGRILATESNVLLDYVFPISIAPGECKRVEIQKWKLAVVCERGVKG